MHTLFLPLFLIFLAVFAKPDGFIRHKLEYIPRTADQIREFHKNYAQPTASIKWHGQQKYYMPNYPKDVFKQDVPVGTPDKNYELSVESGMRRIWLIDVSYPNITGLVHKYDAKHSSTSVPTGEFANDYTGLVNLQGHNYYDKVVDYYGTWLQNISVIKNTYDEFNNPIVFNHVDGIIGLAWDPNEDTKNVTKNSSPILNILRTFSSKRFSLLIERDPTGQTDGGAITFGRYDIRNCKTNYTFVPLVLFDDYSPLSFIVSGFKIKDYKATKDVAAKVDTGLAVIFMPQDQYTIVYNMLKPDFDKDLQILTTECSNKGKFPDWVFTIGGRDFVVSSNYYIVKISGLDHGKCALAMEPSMDHEIQWAFGEPFLREYCSHYDIEKQQLGLSAAI